MGPGLRRDDDIFRALVNLSYRDSSSLRRALARGRTISSTAAADELAATSYGPSTSAAVLAYKEKRDIVNRSYQTKPDNIVGIMTRTLCLQTIVLSAWASRGGTGMFDKLLDRVGCRRHEGIVTVLREESVGVELAPDLRSLEIRVDQEVPSFVPLSAELLEILVGEQL